MPRKRTPGLMLFIVEMNQSTPGARTALTQLVNETLGTDAAGQPWRVEPLFPAKLAPTPALKRFMRVSGQVEAPSQQWDKVAFDIAYKLRDVTGFRVQPDLPSTRYAPPENLEAASAQNTQPGAAGLASGTAGGSHLGGSNEPTWALDFIRARDAWNLTPKPGGSAQGEGILIAHTDTGYTNLPGVDLSWFDLTKDYDVIERDNTALDPLEQWSFFKALQPGHGTTASSAMVGRMWPDIQGAAPKAKVVPIRTIKSVWQVHNSDVAVAVRYAHVQAGAHVIAMTLSGPFFPGLEDALEDAINDGMIVIAAAGNYTPVMFAPAGYKQCLAVAAVNADERPWQWSTLGEKVAISAPGESVWALEFFFNQGGTTLGKNRQHGTTFATALTAGVAALWLAHYGRDNLIAAFGKERLQTLFWHQLRTVGHRRPANWNESLQGAGIIDAKALLSANLPTPSALPAPGAVTLSMAAPTRQPGTIASLFPELSEAAVQERLQVLLGATGAELQAKLERHADELVWIFSEQPAARTAFVDQQPGAGGGGPGLATAGAAGASFDAVLQFGSTTLRSL